jgi:hypothetical protein
MPRPYQRDHAFHVGALLTRTVAGLLALAATPRLAFAEVCDKVAGESWRVGDAPIAFVATIYDRPVPWLIFVACCFFLMFALRVRWLGYVGLAAVAAFAFSIRITLGLPDEVIAGAVKEGCVSWKADTSVTLLPFCVVALYAACLWWITGRGRREVAGHP